MTKRDVSGPEGGLAHNPFGALRGRFGPGADSTGDAAGDVHGTEAAPRAARVVVRYERKGRGGRTVTRAVGLGEPGALAIVGPLEDAARRARKALGLGAHVEDLDLVVQGQCVERLEAWLQKQGLTDVVRGNG